MDNCPSGTFKNSGICTCKDIWVELFIDFLACHTLDTLWMAFVHHVTVQVLAYLVQIQNMLGELLVWRVALMELLRMATFVPVIIYS